METGQQEIPLDEVVVGDLVHLSAGDMVPADIRIIFARDLFVSQSALTGESEPVEKYLCLDVQAASITEEPNLAFMGSNVISGTAVGVGPVSIGQHLQGYLEGEKLLDFYIR